MTHSRPHWDFYTQDEVLVIRLVGYRGGVRHTYALDTVNRNAPRHEKEQIIQNMADLAGLGKGSAKGTRA